MRRFCLVCSLAITASFWTSSPKADSQSYGPFVAEAIRLERAVGRLSLVPAPDEAISIEIEGEEDALAAIEVEEKGDVVTLIGPANAAGASAVVSGSVVTQAIGPGARAQTVIGNQSVIARGSAVGDGADGDDGAGPIHITLHLPETIKLEAVDVALRSDGERYEPALDVDLIRGSLTLATLGPLTLRLSGSGVFRAERVSGSLELALDGNGQIMIGSGTVDEVDIQLAGNGQIRFDGVAEKGSIELTGNGVVHVAQINSAPEVNQSGVGAIRIGSRRVRP